MSIDKTHTLKMNRIIVIKKKCIFLSNFDKITNDNPRRRHKK